MANSIFKPVPQQVGNILKDVNSGRIGLPDLQRPFVWKDKKVAELLDSMIKGYPIGYIMLWESPEEYSDKKESIGTDSKIYEAPKELVIDGQQRLTALLATFFGTEVKTSDFKNKKIQICFNPLTLQFDRPSVAIKNDPYYIDDISVVFNANRNNNISSWRRGYINSINTYLNNKGEEDLTDEMCDEIEAGINTLLKLELYSLPVLEISSAADEEMVADIFVRVNSLGQSLKQDDFIMTLLSVYEPEMREKIEKFCESSFLPEDGTSYNNLTDVTATLLIRTIVGVGFGRGRLNYAYKILRGKDLKTKESSPEIREKNFNTFGESLEKVLNLNNWHSFINIIGEAGYIDKSQVSSQNALFINYAFYLIGKYKFNVGSMKLRQLIRRWFFASSLISYYAGSFETAFDTQLNQIKGFNTEEEFVSYFENLIKTQLTSDYFTVTLPNEFDQNEAIGPRWNAFVASQIILGCKSFMSTSSLAHLLVAGSSGSKNSIDKHHIFPDNYLEQIGHINDRSKRANFTLAKYQDNIYISDEAPEIYVGKFRKDMGEEVYKELCLQHALPLNFETMSYEEFLVQRRNLMSELIYQAFMKI